MGCVKGVSKGSWKDCSTGSLWATNSESQTERCWVPSTGSRSGCHSGSRMGFRLGR